MKYLNCQSLVCLKNSYLQLYSNFPGANELISLTDKQPDQQEDDQYQNNEGDADNCHDDACRHSLIRNLRKKQNVQFYHDDVIKWKHFPHYWPFVRGIHRSPVNSPHKGQWCGALMFSLFCAWKNGWVNNSEAGDLRPYHAHYDVIVMMICASKRIHYIPMIVFVCLHFTIPHCDHYADVSEGIEFLNTCQEHYIECVSKIQTILSIIAHAIYGAVCIQFTLFLLWWLWEYVYYILLSSSNRKCDPFAIV